MYSVTNHKLERFFNNTTLRRRRQADFVPILQPIAKFKDRKLRRSVHKKCSNYELNTKIKQKIKRTLI